MLVRPSDEAELATQEVAGVCRICAAACTMRFTKDEKGRILKARGDPAHPITHGYACSKGLRLHEAHYSSERLLHPLKRTPDGRFVRVSASEALDEIAERLRELIERRGPDAVGVYRGTFGYDNPLFHNLLKALGSRSFFSTHTIDQSAKAVTADRLGSWDAGKDQFHHSDVILLAGVNPLVSNTAFNFPGQNPLRHLRIAKARGMKLIVIDPRRTETAKQADLFLQPWPGTDAILFAGLVREVLVNGWQDSDFCQRHVIGIDGLRQALAPFTPDFVAGRAGVSEAELRAAARMFAEPQPTGGAVRPKRGAATSGTGPDMGPHSNLAEHLLECLNVVCGRFAREGDPITNPGVFSPARRYRAQVVPPRRSWETGWISEATGHGMLLGEKMCGALADEILTPGGNQVRALICDSGNPVNAVPDQARIVTALRSLELLVTVDPFMTNTAKLSHFILPPPMMLERTSVGNPTFERAMMSWPISRFAPPVIDRPEGAELIDGWEVAFQIARRLGVVLELGGQPMDMRQQPSELRMWRQTFRNSRIPFDEIARRPPGHLFDGDVVRVEAGAPAADARFDVAPEDVRAELVAVLHERPTDDGFTHRLAVRRMREVLNTAIQHPSARQRRSYNPAFLNPADMASLSLREGDWARLISPYGAADVRIAADPDVKVGVVSLPHGWGGLPGEDNSDDLGTNSNLLLSSVDCRDPINAMPVMTGVPLRIIPRPGVDGTLRASTPQAEAATANSSR